MIWLLLGLIALAGLLAVVAAQMWRKVWRQSKQRQQATADALERQSTTEQNRLDYVHESLNVIASAVLDDQCPMTEGCIRMAVLLDNLSLDCETKHRFSLIFEIYNATRHIPTHSSWQALDRKTQRRFQQEMFALERKHQSDIKALMAHIRSNPFGKGVGAALH